MFRHFSKQEARNLVFLAIPVFLGQIAQIAMSFVDTVVAGRASTVDMAAVAVATSFWIPGTMFGQGLLFGLIDASLFSTHCSCSLLLNL